MRRLQEMDLIKSKSLYLAFSEPGENFQQSSLLCYMVVYKEIKSSRVGC